MVSLGGFFQWFWFSLDAISLNMVSLNVVFSRGGFLSVCGGGFILPPVFILLSFSSSFCLFSVSVVLLGVYFSFSFFF